ncbi:MAG TPA: quinoprotein relay system zinc metallohydrolase 2 [Steroidobacteraceae bacterium]|nr:quinoprotein relay system zinc metallohydrolase 2 [Steroidobacteraceae bacterium]
MGAAESRGVIAIGLLACSMGLAAAAPRDFNLSEPAAGVYVHSGRQLPLDAPGHEDIANSGFIVGNKCVAVIDTGGSVAVGRQLRDAIRKHTTLPICYVINTHVHVDHVLGNAAFKTEHPQFVGNAALPDAMARSTDFFLEKYAGDLDPPPGADQIVSPDLLVKNELTLDLGARTLQLHAWPKAHTDCDLTVYDPKTATLWSGDLLFRQRLPALDGSLEGWLAALDVLAGMKATLVVPGHGPVARDLGAALAPERRYLHALSEGVRAELSRGESLQHAIDHVAAAEKPHWLLWDSVHPHNVVRAYQELEWD